ncbi:hypothetical protein B7Z28_02140, partial [Candidatus Saccharibacteria bacterium 32-45-3]
MQDVDTLKAELLDQIATSETPHDVLKDPRIKQLYGTIATLPIEERAEFGKAVNELKISLEDAIASKKAELEDTNVEQLDVTAPWDTNSTQP